MTASTEASSDSDTDVDGEAVVDHLPHDDATDDTAPGQDAGVGPASLAFTSFLLAMLCLSPFYMLGSNLWDLMNGRGLLLEFSDLTSQTQRLPFKHATVQMISGYSTTVRLRRGVVRRLTILHRPVHQHPPHPHRGLRSRLRPVHRRDSGRPPGIRRPALHPGGHLFWLLLGQALSSLTLHVAGLAISSDYLTLGNPQGQSLSGFIPTGNDIPILKSVIILILATHLLLALHRVYQRSSTLAAENTVLRKETEGLV